LAKLVVQSPHLYGSFYLTFFSGTGAIGGIIFGVGLLLFAKKFNDLTIRNFLLIAALGMLYFFILNQDPPLGENLNPPFGIVSKSFVGLSCYMIFLGFYSTVIYMSRKGTVASVVLKEMSRDKLFGSLVRSEQERQAEIVINKSMISIQENSQLESKELSKEEIESLVTMVRTELTKKENSSNSGE